MADSAAKPAAVVDPKVRAVQEMMQRKKETAQAATAKPLAKVGPSFSSGGIAKKKLPNLKKKGTSKINNIFGNAADESDDDEMPVGPSAHLNALSRAYGWSAADKVCVQAEAKAMMKNLGAQTVSRVPCCCRDLENMTWNRQCHRRKPAANLAAPGTTTPRGLGKLRA
jgi:hypothetical protein